VNNDHIGYRYEVKSFLGKGSFGTAVKCLDHKTGEEIALKIVKNKKKYYYQAGVELKILQFLKENDPDDIMNVIHLNDYVIFRKHLCIGFELLSMNMFDQRLQRKFITNKFVGVRPQPYSAICDPAALCIEVPENVLNNPL
jgi:dual specificity tyrosine-phosphorylation-regulated kinase 2/3/4